MEAITMGEKEGKHRTEIKRYVKNSEIFLHVINEFLGREERVRNRHSIRNNKNQKKPKLNKMKKKQPSEIDHSTFS